MLAKFGQPSGCSSGPREHARNFLHKTTSMLAIPFSCLCNYITSSFILFLISTKCLFFMLSLLSSFHFFHYTYPLRSLHYKICHPHISIHSNSFFLFIYFPHYSAFKIFLNSFSFKLLL